MANEIFISYSRKDFDKVRQIKESIDKELGIDCWMDMDGIESGDQFKEVIISAIVRHEIILFMMTSNSMDSPWALKEINFAERKKKRIILVDIGHCSMTDAFMFDYGDKDNIDWDNKIQHDKLIKNLKKWLGKSQHSKGQDVFVNQEKKTINVHDITTKANRLYLFDKYKEAVALYIQAAQLDDTEAQVGLAGCYYYGKGVMRDLKEALMWYEKAASKNNSLAIDRVSEIKKLLSRKKSMYAHDMTLKANRLYLLDKYKEAFLLYQESANLGDTEAQVGLAGCYYYGKGVMRDLKESLKWYEKAASKNNGLAIDRAKYIRKILKM